MFTPTGRSFRGAGRISVDRRARGSKRRTLVLVTLAALALYALAGSVAGASAAKLPTVSSVAPGNGPASGGTAVTIEGTFFKNVKAVKFGSTNAASFAVKSATSITATSPAGTVGTVDVTVTISGGRTSPTGPADHFEFTPAITGISPDTGAAAGGTPVTITGSGFAVGKASTQFAFGFGSEATEVNCTSTTECTATTAEISKEEGTSGIVNVTATVNGVMSPETPAAQFHYHGLFFVGERGRIQGEDVILDGSVGGNQTNACNAGLNGGVGSNGQVTVELGIGVGAFTACNQEEFFHALPFSYVMRLGSDGSATVEAPMGIHTGNGCVYEGDRLTGSFPVGTRFEAGLGGTFTLVAEEEPGAECAPTETVSLGIGAVRNVETELIG
jgi:hypothetical protein